MWFLRSQPGGGQAGLRRRSPKPGCRVCEKVQAVSCSQSPSRLKEMLRVSFERLPGSSGGGRLFGEQRGIHCKTKCWLLGRLHSSKRQRDKGAKCGKFIFIRMLRPGGGEVRKR